jgi:hypothetical protein
MSVGCSKLRWACDNVLGTEVAGGDVAVFTAQITGLAGLGLGSIADGHFAALVGIEMGAGASAVSVGWDGLLVDVVH